MSWPTWWCINETRIAQVHIIEIRIAMARVLLQHITYRSLQERDLLTESDCVLFERVKQILSRSLPPSSSLCSPMPISRARCRRSLWFAEIKAMSWNEKRKIDQKSLNRTFDIVLCHSLSIVRWERESGLTWKFANIWSLSPMLAMSTSFVCDENFNFRLICLLKFNFFLKFLQLLFLHSQLQTLPCFFFCDVT